MIILMIIIMTPCPNPNGREMAIIIIIRRRKLHLCHLMHLREHGHIRLVTLRRLEAGLCIVEIHAGVSSIYGQHIHLSASLRSIEQLMENEP